MKIPTVEILNIPIHNITLPQTIQIVREFFLETSLHQIVTVNPEFVMEAQRDLDFQKVLQEAELCIPDGVGLIYASQWYGNRLTERVPGSELVYHLAELAAQEKWRLFLLGAGPGIADQAAKILQAKYPALIIAGTYGGSPDPAENELIVTQINDSKTDLLYVAYGAPNQDKWIARNRANFESVRVAIGVGGALDFITGKTKRAPVWIQKLNLEWFYRLVQEPWRWRRMLALPRFAIKVLLTPKS